MFQSAAVKAALSYGLQRALVLERHAGELLAVAERSFLQGFDTISDAEISQAAVAEAVLAYRR